MRHPHLVRLLALSLTASIFAPPSFAQAVDEEETEVQQAQLPPGFILPPRLRQIAFRDANPWTFHVNMRYKTGESDVSFSDLGQIRLRSALPGADQTTFPQRNYDDGAVGLDGLRANEKDANGNQTSTPGGRYTAPVSSAEDAPDGDYLAYTPGQTRYWYYQNDSQYDAGTGTMAMNAYSTTSNGASLSAPDEGDGIGFEMAVARRLFRINEKTEINLTASLGLTDIKARTSDTITANLVTLTDRYAVFGDAPVAPYFAPAFADLFDDIGNVAVEDGFETTVPLQQITPDRTVTTANDAAIIDGSWELSGAYYSMRIGAEIRTHLHDKFALRAGAGLLGAFVGTDFMATESLQMPEDYVINAPITIQDINEQSELIIGYYGEIAAEFWFTARTSVFFGAAWESIDNFEQTVGGRTAALALGDQMVVRIGLVTRF